jgi:peptide-methionine (S)-S-oxide reductase
MQGKNDGILGWARNAKMGTQLAPTTAPEGQALATFAGGCFWGLELQMQRVPGVVKTSVGYTGVRLGQLHDTVL